MAQRTAAVKNPSMPKKKTVLLIVITAALTLLLSSVISLLLENRRVIDLPSVGNIKTIGLEVYVDEQLTNRSENISWGTVYPGSVINITRYVRSISNRDINLSMTLENWQFRNSSGVVLNNTAYIYVSWDAEGKTLKPDQSVKVVFTLTVTPFSDFVYFVAEKQVESFVFDLRLSPSDYSYIS